MTRLLMVVMWLAVLCGARAAAQEPAAHPTAEEFAQESDISDVQLSPSGRYVVSLMAKDGDSYFSFLDLQTPDAKAVGVRLSKTNVYDFEWIGDERIVYRAGSSSFGLEVRSNAIVVTGVPRFFAMDRGGGNEIQFFQSDKRINKDNWFMGSGATTIPGDHEHVLLPVSVKGAVDLLKVNARSGEWTTVADGSRNTIGWMADGEGQAVLRMDSNSRGTELRILTPETRTNGKVKWKQVAKLRRDRKSGRAPDFTPIGPGPEPHLLHVLGRPPGADRIGVHIYDLKAETYVQEVYVNTTYDIAAAFVNDITGAFEGAAYWGDQLEIEFVDTNLQKHIRGLKQFYGADISLSIRDANEENTVWLLYVSGPRDPGSFHVYDTTAAFSRQIARLNPLVGSKPLGDMQPVAYQARDGLALHGYLTLPPDAAPDVRPPLIVYPHGGPEVRDKADYHPVVQFLATRGYAVFQPNFRGSSGFGENFAKAGRRQFGRAMQTDIDDGVAWLAQQELVDGERICILGESYGGYAALMGVATQPDRYRCAASVMGMSDLRKQILWDRKEEGSDSEAYKYWVEQLGDPRKDREEMDANSPISLIDNIRAPVLLVHGTRDDNVPIEQSEMMEEALLKAGRKVRFVRMENAGHGFEGEQFVAYLRELERFFGEHLPVTRAAASEAAQ